VKSKVVLITVSCLLATAFAQMPLVEEPQRARWQVYALEGRGAVWYMVGGGCLETVGCGAACGAAVPSLAVGCGAFGLPSVLAVGVAGALLAAAVLPYAAAVLPAAAAYGTIRTGQSLGERGSTGWAFGGAYAGALVGVGVGVLGFKVSKSSAVRIPACVLGVLAVPTGAVVGYNLVGGYRESWPSFQPDLGGRLQPPGVALTSVELPDHSAEYGVKVQLAGLRF
jgi:hypothetical protein